MIGILTFHWADDYGAMLQAYALKSCLEELGREEVEVIPYAPVRLEGRYWLFPVVGVETGGKVRYNLQIWGIARNVLCFFSFLRRRKNMRNFRHRYLTAKPAVRKAENLSLEKYTRVFVGSDQVWNPEITVGLDHAYIGNVKEKGNCKLIAYGASFGKASLPDRYRTVFEKAVNRNFYCISLREKSAVPYVKSFFHGNVTDVLDPTLLLRSKEWKKIGRTPEQKHYILFIYTEYNAQMMEYLRDLSVKLKKKVIQVSMPWPGQRKDWLDVEIKGGPSEFVGFFQHADCVVTNSFHGMVFSVLMEKNFLVFGHSKRNARMENFLEKIELKSRLIEQGRMPAKEEMMQEIDWERVGEFIEKERRHSLDYIKSMLV
ncbi:hypothetical protein C818_00100 [Lachnospiraceae bacterium MD308]|nr:hypothetical protein C818_00100 [Lachnospiraceae bacterium MD308]